MNSVVTRAALSDVAVRLEKAREAKDQIGRETGGGPSGGGYEYPEAALAHYLGEVYQMLLVVLEAAELPATRSHLVEQWGTLSSAETTYLEGIRHFREQGV